MVESSVDIMNNKICVKISDMEIFDRNESKW